MKTIQDSTFNLLNNLDDNRYIKYSFNIVNNIKKHLSKYNKDTSILFVINAEIEPDIDTLIEYCFNSGYKCYLLTYKNNQIQVKLINYLNIDKAYYLYTKKPLLNTVDSFNQKVFDIIIAPIMNFDKNKFFIDTNYNLIFNLIGEIKHREFWAYAFNFQEYSNLERYTNVKADIIFTNDKIIK